MKRTIEDVESRLQERIPNIIIDRSTYKDTKTKCKLLHPTFGEWWVIPKDVIGGRSKRPKWTSLTEFKSRLPKDFKWTLIDESFTGIGNKAKFVKDGIIWEVLPENILHKGWREPFERWDSITAEKEIKKNQSYVSLDHSTYTNSYSKARFIDKIYGEWWARPFDIINGGKHPKRAKNKILTLEEIKERLLNNNSFSVIDDSTYKSASRLARFIDIDYGEYWDKPYRIIRGGGHPKRCNRGLEAFLSSKTGIPIYDKKPPFLPKGVLLRPDFMINDNNYVEADGIYWHSLKDKYHHFNRRELFESYGKRLLQFRENEILHKTDVVVSYINNILNKNTIVDSSKCSVVYNIKNLEFFNRNHLIGSSNNNAIFLRNENTDVFGVEYLEHTDCIIINRFCNRVGYNVIDGLKKRIRILESHKPVVIMLDLRFDTIELSDYFREKVVLNLDRYNRYSVYGAGIAYYRKKQV